MQRPRGRKGQGPWEAGCVQGGCRWGAGGGTGKR